MTGHDRRRNQCPRNERSGQVERPERDERDERDGCPAIEPLLSAWIDGAVDIEDSARVSAHLPGCVDCGQIAEGLLLVADAATELLPTGLARRSARFPNRPTAPPNRIGAAGVDGTGDRFAGTLARLVQRRRRTLCRLVRRILAQRSLRRHPIEVGRARLGWRDEGALVARSRVVVAELLGLDSDRDGLGARLVESLDAPGDLGDSGAEAIGLRRAFSELRAFEASSPLTPPLPPDDRDASAVVRWARAELSPN